MPRTQEGRKLIAHELTHVVQQGRGLGATAAPPLLRRSPSKNKYKCSAVTLVGTRLTLYGNLGAIIVKAKPLDIPPGKYLVSSGEEPGALYIKPVEKTVNWSSDRILSYDWDVPANEVAAFQEKIDGYVASLTSPVPMTVTGTHAKKPSTAVSDEGTGSGVSGSGDSGRTEGSGGADEPKKEPTKVGSGGEKIEGQPGTGKTDPPATGGTTTGGAGETPGGGQKVAADFQAKLTALFDGTTDAKLDDEQMRQLRNVLDKMTVADIALFKKWSVRNPGGDIEGLVRSLRLFASTKELYEKQPPPTKQPQVPDESQKILTDAMKQYRDDMRPEDKERLARATIEALSNRQLRNLTAGQIRREHHSCRQAGHWYGDGNERWSRPGARSRGWGCVAGVSRAVKGAAGFWGFLAFAAIIASAFVPGLEIIVLSANALAATMVVFAAATIQEQAEIKAAGGADTAELMQKHIMNGTQARTERIVTGVMLALPVAAKLLGRLPIPPG